MAQWSLYCVGDVTTKTDLSDLLLDHIFIYTPVGLIQYECTDQIVPVGYTGSPSGMTADEFNQLWPLVLGIMVLGFLVRVVRRVFE